MKADEYDLLITDPSFYFRNFYLPRVFGALEPLEYASSSHRHTRNVWSCL